MESIIFLILIYFLFKLIVQRTRENRKKNEKADAARKQANATAPKPPQKRKKEAPIQKPEAPRPALQGSAPGMPYQPIQPTVTARTTLSDYAGSLGGASTEGNASREGGMSVEGTGSAEGRVSSEGGEVFDASILGEAPDAYVQTNANGAVPVLPALWNRSALVQAVVMKEILDRPQGRRGSHG